MIDDRFEKAITFKEAAAQCPGKPCSYHTIRRWADVGMRGHRLETLRRGGWRYTSVEALRRFFERLSHHDGSPFTDADAKRQAEEASARIVARWGA